MDNFKKICLSKGMFVLVDIDDYGWLSNHIWYYNKHYAMTKINGKTVQMHRLIMDCPKGLVVDHIDGHRLDNRRSNLRICTIKQNAMNLGRRRNTSSIYNGVFKLKENGKFGTKLTQTIGVGKNKRRVHTHIAELDNERLSAYAWDVVAKSVRGEYARLNEVKVTEEEHHFVFNRRRVTRLENKLGIKLRLDYPLK